MCSSLHGAMRTRSESPASLQAWRRNVGRVEAGRATMDAGASAMSSPGSWRPQTQSADRALDKTEETFGGEPRSGPADALKRQRHRVSSAWVVLRSVIRSPWTLPMQIHNNPFWTLCVFNVPVLNMPLRLLRAAISVSSEDLVLVPASCCSCCSLCFYHGQRASPRGSMAHGCRWR